MTLEQTGAIMDVLTVAYPQFYSKISDDDKYKASMLWAEMFADDAVETVVAAVKSFIATDAKGFPPVIGVIKDHVSKLTYGYQKTELEAWAEVKKAISRSLYNCGRGAEIQFKNLDPVIQRIVGSPQQLREWAMVQEGTPINVVASNFQRSYKAIAANQREYRALPGPVADIVNTLAEGMDSKPKHEPEPEKPKELPVSVDAIVEEIHETVKGFRFTEMPSERMTDDEFAKKKAEILKSLEVSR